jgi:hypothetical protein
VTAPGIWDFIEPGPYWEPDPSLQCRAPLVQQPENRVYLCTAPQGHTAGDTPHICAHRCGPDGWMDDGGRSRWKFRTDAITEAVWDRHGAVIYQLVDGKVANMGERLS